MHSLAEASFSLQVLSLPASVCVYQCVCLSACQSLACPHDNWGPVQVRITKFGPKVQNNLVKVPVVLWSDWSCPSRSNLMLNVKFLLFWAYLHHNSSPIQTRITKFRPEVQCTLVKFPIVLEANWPWTSRSNLTYKSQFLVSPLPQTQNHHITTILYHFAVLTVFTVSTLCTYTDQGSWGYFGF